MSKSKHSLHLILGVLLGLTLLLASCKPTIPSEYIQPDEMEDVLYDYHLAMGMATQQGDVAVNQRVYKMAVLKKHGVSEHQFDSSLAYYMRHTVLLKRMYEELTKRYENEARLQGASESDLTQFGTITAKGDTADIWHGSRVLMLSPYTLVNQHSYNVLVDTAFHKGDRFVMTYDAKYIVQEGIRDAVAVLSVRFSNDSIATQTQHIYSEGRQTMVIDNPDTLGIKSVKGYFLMLKGQQPSTTFKLLVLQNISLVRMHVRKPTAEELKKDSLKNQDPIRAIGGTPVRRDVPMPSTPSAGSGSLPQRTPRQAMQERGIPVVR